MKSTLMVRYFMFNQTKINKFKVGRISRRSCRDKQLWAVLMENEERGKAEVPQHQAKAWD